MEDEFTRTNSRFRKGWVPDDLRGELFGGDGGAGAEAEGELAAVDLDDGAVAGGVVAERGDAGDGFANGDPDAALIAAAVDAEERGVADGGHADEFELGGRRCSDG